MMEPANFGPFLRDLREKKNLGLRELSRIADIAPASLSAIEKGESSPTLATLHKLLKALGTDFSSFFEEASLADTPVFPADHTRQVNDAHRVYQILFPKRSDLRFEMLVETIAATEGESEWETHDCDMGGLLLEGGPLKLQIQDRGEWIVNAGDSFYVKAQQKHRAINAGSMPARMVTVCAPPRY
jgi:transcriptional regulator with XRE-family HTH domain